MADPFLVGERVSWTSQGSGVCRTRVGEVVAVVPAGVSPTEIDTYTPQTGERFLFRVDRPGMTRSEESYLVRSDGKLYWPRVTGLSRVAPRTEVRMDLSNVDWVALRRQKELLLLGYHPVPGEYSDALDGILHLIDALQDRAEEVLGSEPVFGTEFAEGEVVMCENCQKETSVYVDGLCSVCGRKSWLKKV